MMSHRKEFRRPKNGKFRVFHSLPISQLEFPPISQPAVDQLFLFVIIIIK